MIRLTLEVKRDNDAGWQRYECEVASPHSRILDALLDVRTRLDPTLGFRWFCRVGMCGSCAAVVNGREILVCQATVGEYEGKTLRIEPLRGFPVQHDLMVDLSPMFERLRAADAALKAREPNSDRTYVEAPTSRPRADIEARNGCITCGACDSSSGVGDAKSGPAALNRVLMLALDGRDQTGRARLKSIDPKAPAFAHPPAKDICPQRIDLADSLAQLKTSAGRAAE